MRPVAWLVVSSSLAAAACSWLVSTSNLTGGVSGDAGGGDAGGAGDSFAADAVISPVLCDGGVADTGTCSFIGGCCPAAAPYCRVAVDLVAHSWSYSCAAAPGPRQQGDPCVPDAGQCGESLSCGLVYPQAGIAPEPGSYACVPLCQTDSQCCTDGGSCPFNAAFCNYRLDPASLVKQCSSCDPTGTGQECGTQTCVASSSSQPPACIDCFGVCGVGLGLSCNDINQCEKGLACACAATNDGGPTGLGVDCSASVGNCTHTCLPYDVGKPCPSGRVCTLVAGSDYAVCW